MTMSADRRTSRISLIAGVLGCAFTAPSALDAQPAPPPGWAFKPIAPLTPEVRVLLIYDMEGLSGIDRPEMTWCSHAEDFKRGVDWLVADVNAVVDAGAKQIVVLDRHGSGCDDAPELPAARLDPRAHLA